MPARRAGNRRSASFATHPGGERSWRGGHEHEDRGIIAESSVVYTFHLMLGNSRQGRSGWGRRLLYPAIALAAGGLVGYFAKRPQEVEAGARNLVAELIRTSDEPPSAGFSIEGTARTAIAALLPPREIQSVVVVSDHAGHLATVVVTGAAGGRVELDLEGVPAELRSVRRADTSAMDEAKERIE